jgi:site-specific DNA recombinase
MSTQTPLRTGLYLRISEDRRDGAGVERQEKECRELAERLGWTVLDVFTDNDISASSYSRKTRTDFARLVKAIESGRINAVIAWDSDRMFRRVDEHEKYIKLCTQYGIQNAAVRVGEIDYDTPIGRFNARMHINMASYESEHKADRVRAAHRQIAENGGFHGGIRAFGYEPDGLTVREVEAAEIRRVADAVINGQSLRSLALELNQRGITTVTGKRWSSAHLGRMLLRARLVGQREHHGKIVAEAQWPPILEVSTWEAVKAVLLDPNRCNGGGGQRGRVPTCLGSGLYHCGSCGEPRMRLGRSNGRRPVYKCGGAMDLPNNQKHVTRVAGQLDAFVEGALLELLSRPGAVEAMCAVIDTEDVNVTALQHEQAELRKELKRLAAACDAGDIDIDQLAIASRRKRARDKEITEAITAAQKRSPVSVLLGAESVEQVWDHHLTLGQKRAILTEVLKVTILPSGNGRARGGRAPDGSYFRSDGIHIELTEQASSRLERVNIT